MTPLKERAALPANTPRAEGDLLVTLQNHEIVAMIDNLLNQHGIPAGERGRYVRENRATVPFLRALTPLVDRYLALVDPPRTCQVEHRHWEGWMICGNPLPCRTHGGG